MVHEHYFNIRLDMCIDGDENTLLEVEAARVETGPSNLHGNAHGVKETAITSEKYAGRDTKPENARFWKVINPSKKIRWAGTLAINLFPAQQLNRCINLARLLCGGQGLSGTIYG